MTTAAVPLIAESELPRPTTDEERGFGCLSTSKGALPLKAMDVQANLLGHLAHTVVKQTFINTHADALEATYIFPLPDRAAVTGFRMEVAGRIIDGELKERGQARREYSAAIQAGHRAAITEEERPGTFTMRVGNIMPGESATVRLTLTGLLPVDGNEVTWRFPLVVAPRYIPGTALEGDNVGDGTAQDTDAVPDASRISPPVLLEGFPNPVRLSLSVDIDRMVLPLSDVRCSLHSVVVDGGDARVRRLRLQPGERLNRDFILRFTLGATDVASALRMVPDENGDSATFMLTVHPPQGAPEVSRPRDVIFVLDRSGSMQGWKMVAARRAVARMVDTLRPADRFNCYAFDDEVETPPRFGGTGLTDATDRNRFHAIEFLSKVDARNGTEMQKPLSVGLQTLAGGYQDRDRILVLITDGQVGNESQLLKTLGQQMKNTRIFTLGIDTAVNAGFLMRLASSSGGQCELVESEDRLDAVMEKVHRRIDTPLLSELSLSYQGLQVEPQSVMPARLPDLFPSGPVLIMGRGVVRGEPSITVSGRRADGSAFKETVDATRESHPGVAAVWARGHLRDLEDLFDGGRGDRKALERRMVETSLKFGVLCRFTAYVAVDHAEKVNPGGKQHQVVQPVESPAGWEQQSTLAGGGGPSVRARFAAAPMSPAPMARMVDVMDDSAPAAAKEEAALDGFHDEGGPPKRMQAPMGPPTAKARKKAGGVVMDALETLVGAGRSVVEAIGKGGGGPVHTLASLRQRVQEALDRMATTLADADRVRVLGVLRAELEAVFNDARAIRVADTQLWSLREAVDKVQAFTPSNAGEPAATWNAVEELLRAFVRGDAPPVSTGKRREEFWR